MEDDSKLISCVEDFVFLYNKKDMEYKNSSARENAWRTIASITDMSVERCQKRWITLKNKYSEIRKKRKNIASGSARNGSTYEWPLYNSMMFLDKHMIVRKTFCNVKPKLKETSYFEESYTPYFEDGNSQELEEGLPMEDNSLSTAEPLDISPFVMSNLQTSTAGPSSDISTPYGRKRKYDVNDSVEKAMSTLGGFLESRRVETQDDPEMVFGKSMGLLLKDVKCLKTRRLLQSHICSTICDAINNQAD